MKLSVPALALALFVALAAPAAPTGPAGAVGPAIRATSKGIIKKQGITSYMYGTHVLVDDGGRTLYALKSDSIKLDPYIGRKVTVSGALVKGYPLEGGPDYLDVEAVDEDAGGPPRGSGCGVNDRGRRIAE